MKDIYDLEIERLTKEKNNIIYEWAFTTPLFKIIGEGFQCGCLTQIKGFNAHAEINGKRNEALEQEIKNDSRLPDRGSKIKLKHLPIFAEWQRKIDALNKTNQ